MRCAISFYPLIHASLCSCRRRSERKRIFTVPRRCRHCLPRCKMTRCCRLSKSQRFTDCAEVNCSVCNSGKQNLMEKHRLNMRGSGHSQNAMNRIYRCCLPKRCFPKRVHSKQFRMRMQNDATSHMKGNGVDQFGKICSIERILRLHQRDTLSGDLRFGVCFFVKLTCNFAEQGNDPFLTWTLLLHFIGDLLLQIQHHSGIPMDMNLVGRLADFLYHRRRVFRRSGRSSGVCRLHSTGVSVHGAPFSERVCAAR